MNTVNEIRDAVVAGYDNWKEHRINVRELDDLVLLSYDATAQFANEWTPVERLCRGLIINKVTGEIVARPFPKFLNWGQNGEYARSARLIEVTEKMDGSLGILYRHDGEYKIATKGSFESPQAQWATQYLQANYNLRHLPSCLTLLFEIIAPAYWEGENLRENLVVDYEGSEGLALLGVIDRHTGYDYPFHSMVYETALAYGFMLPQTYRFDNVKSILAAAAKLEGRKQEGYVLRFSDGSRFKIKGDDYLWLSKAISNLNFNSVVDAIYRGILPDYIAAMPDEFRVEINEYAGEVWTEIRQRTDEINELWDKAPKGVSRKEFALWVQANVPSDYRGLMFKMLDTSELDMRLLFKAAFDYKGVN